MSLYAIHNKKSRHPDTYMHYVHTYVRARIIGNMKSSSSYSYIVIGLGNPGKEYEHTRHNAGRNAVLRFVKENNLSPFEENKKLRALASEDTIEKTKIWTVLPETFMNKSGITAKNLNIKNKKQIAESVIVVHDDLDLPIGTIKIVKNRGSAGHKGVESVMRALGTRDFTRVRIGIAKPAHIKKSQSEEIVIKTVIGKILPDDANLLKKGIKRAAEALRTIAENGVDRAMNEWN
ncbi:MAG: hypothetical protein A3J54_00090 [Candidatus Ryanbacteria bacterium RIFCSPHIGHO2_02_FULL_45_13b]|uniref:Peptidyl-tRNA hydrolase n=1 Tax=Candidatus Ryanbacteria bacterium RIFCSPHIGHO2_02_FULL_45_13b TaxID=1802117 RepID=A0A1G2G9Y8_9BACT|nr:MAG: hypothetical protein A3J54_00090 [Candidatus Ryanbacteria bacterium RIFCSPHIGHO2_02_FULL_45_13b]